MQSLRTNSGGSSARPLVIKLVRHALSTANTRLFDPQSEGDFRTPVTAEGLTEARRAGARIAADFFRDALVYCSPYLRATQTLQALLEGAGTTAETPIGVYEDPRLREQEHGYGDIKGQEDKRRTHGWFYYRYEGGESPADCYDRTSGFMESMMRQVERKDAKRVVIVSHGMTIRCFVMRFLRLTVEQFEALENPDNCDIVTIAPKEQCESDSASFVHGAWCVTGLRTRAP